MNSCIIFAQMVDTGGKNIARDTDKSCLGQYKMLQHSIGDTGSMLELFLLAEKMLAEAHVGPEQEISTIILVTSLAVCLRGE